MRSYLILRNPGHNRVYFDQSEKMARAELKLLLHQLDPSADAPEVLELAGLNYLSFSLANALTDQDLQLISRLSFIFGLFELEGNVQAAKLIPMLLPPSAFVDPKISMLMKYAGKTNEIFTRMMINVAQLSQSGTEASRLHILDPAAGKGTTLFEGAIAGFDVTGIEIDRKLTQETSTFFKAFLEREKYKHTLTKSKLYSGNSEKEAISVSFTYARDKEQFNDPAQQRDLQIISGTALHSKRYFKDEKFHLIVADLPYGIAHGNVGNKKHRSKTRSPEELLESCLPDWFKILKKGGVMVLAWNLFVFPRQTMVDLIESKGFKVFKSSPYDEFQHRVDQSIKRDIVVAAKPA
jgi:SAM-dependent methyltransferase